MKYSLRILSTTLLVSLCATQAYAGKRKKHTIPAIDVEASVLGSECPAPVLPEAPKALDLSSTMILVQQTQENQIKLHQKAALMRELNQEEAALEAALLFVQEKKNRLKTMGRENIATLQLKANNLAEKITAKETALTTVENSLALLCKEISKNSNNSSQQISTIEQLQAEQEKLRNEINDLSSLRAKILKNIQGSPKPTLVQENNEIPSAPEESSIQSSANPIEEKPAEEKITVAPVIVQQNTPGSEPTSLITEQEKNEQSSWTAMVYGWTLGLFSGNK